MHINVDQLHLNFVDAGGHQHRVRHIVDRALALLQQRLRDESPGTRGFADLSASRRRPITLDLRQTSDEVVAQRVMQQLHAALRAPERPAAAPGTTDASGMSGDQAEAQCQP